MLEEVGEPYELIDTSLRVEDLQAPEYLRLNPNARIPTLIDGEFVLWESMAINLYLAQKYDSPVQTNTAEDHAIATQWSFWAMIELEESLTQLLHHRMLLVAPGRDPSRAERAELLLRRPLTVLDESLADKEFLLGDNFTVADLNVAALVSWAKIGRLDFSALPKLKRWLDTCLARPAYQRVRDMVRGEEYRRV
jgi:glutathione S-transferase